MSKRKELDIELEDDLDDVIVTAGASRLAKSELYGASDNSHRRPLRVGIIGLGRAVFDTHLPAFKKIPDLYRITAVCDLLKERRAIVEQDYPDVHTYRRIEDMLDDPEIDVVDIALPSNDHVQAALDTLNHGKWAVLEMPLAYTFDSATLLKGAAVKARNKLLPHLPDLFSAEYRLAQIAREKAEADPNLLGEVFEVRVRRQDYLRRDDWLSVKRCGGGCVWSEGTGVILQAVNLLKAQPSQLWSELKRVASLGDAEDFAHIVLKTRTEVTADIEICGGQIEPREPAFTIRGSRGSFSVMPGAESGRFHVIDPAFKFPRRRSSVRTPGLEDRHEDLPVLDIPLSLPPDETTGPVAFWTAVYATIRTAVPFPVTLDEVVDAVRYLQIVKQSSPFATK